MGKYITLYHITKKENIEKIEMMGVQSQYCQDSLIHLSDKRSIPYWNILMNGDVLLAVKIPKGSYLKNKYYYNYTDIVYYASEIPPNYIKVVPFPDTRYAMQQLCSYYLYRVNGLVSWISGIDMQEFDDSELVREVRDCTHMLKRLDFTVLCERDVREALEEFRGEDDKCFTDSSSSRPSLQLYASTFPEYYMCDSTNDYEDFYVQVRKLDTTLHDILGSPIDMEQTMCILVDWLFAMCNKLKGRSLSECATEFFNELTSDKLSKILCMEVSPELVDGVLRRLKPVEDKLLVWCCGTPIVNGYDNEVSVAFDAAVEFLMNSLFSDN